MTVTAVFLIVVFAHLVLTLIHYRAGFFLFIFLYGLYPRFFAFGFSDEGFALTGQRAMLMVLFAFFLLRVLWGSAEIGRTKQLILKYKALLSCLSLFLLSRLAGNIVSGRLDVGSVGALVSESLLSLFIVLLVLTYVRTRQDIRTLIGLVVLSLLINQGISTYEVSIGESIFPQSIDLQYQDDNEDADLLAGKERANSYRAMGLFDNALELAGLLCLALPLAISSAATSSSYLLRVLAIFSVTMAVPTALFTGSRAALGVTLLIFLWYVYERISRGLSGKGRFFLGVIGAAVGALIILTAATGLLENLLLGEGYAGSTTYRVMQYVYGYQALLDSPVFGYGFARNIGDIVSIRPLDSFYLRMLLEGGIAAFLLVLFTLVKTLKLVAKIRRMATRRIDRSVGYAIGISISVALIVMLVFSLPADRLYVFMLVGLAMVLHDLVSQGSDKSLTA